MNHAEGGNQWRLQPKTSSRNPRPRTAPITSGVLAESVQVVVLRDGATEQSAGGSLARRRSIARPAAGLDGSCFGIAVMSASPFAVWVGMSAATCSSVAC